jgi:hypothetical protein
MLDIQEQDQYEEITEPAPALEVIATLHRNPMIDVERSQYVVRRLVGRDQFLLECMAGRIVYTSDPGQAAVYTNFLAAADAANYCWLACNAEYSFVVEQPVPAVEAIAKEVHFNWLKNFRGGDCSEYKS